MVDEVQEHKCRGGRSLRATEVQEHKCREGRSLRATEVQEHKCREGQESDSDHAKRVTLESLRPII